MIPPLRLESDGLVLRCWTPDLAPLLRVALEVAWDDLQRWIPWVFAELEDVPVLRERLAGYEADFRGGGNALYAVMDPGEAEVWGGAGLYRRVGPGALEIGYWIRTDRAGRGLATKASALLTEAGLALEGIHRMEIRCDPEHVASAAIPRKLGYRHRETLIASGCTPAEEAGHAGQDTMVWELTAEASHGGGRS